ncbi:MAG: glycosyltransferase family 4 protein [Kiritimatiellae bacterium]|nr:glycosyltransferase family 4 protein [Kiritimatiellia bacterium]
MKVLFFCNLLAQKMGSFEVLIEEMGKVLKNAGDELVIVLPLDPLPDVGYRWSNAGIRLRLIQGWSDEHGVECPWKFCRPAWRILSDERPDVAVVHFGNELPSFLVSCFACKRVKWVWQQDQQIRNPTVITVLISKIRLLSLRFKHFVAVYEGAKYSLLARGIPEQKIMVINNAVSEYNCLKPSGWLRDELKFQKNTIIISTIGSLIPRKRVDMAIRAFHKAITLQSKDACLVLVGEGPERFKLQRLVKDLGIIEKVFFLGLRNDVREILSESSILLHSSMAEACTYAVTESMAAGIPAVVTEAGAAREQIVSGQTGYVVGKDDLDGLVSCLSRLIEDGAGRTRMGAAAKERWKSMYKVEVSAKKYYDLYHSLINQNKY